MSDPFEESSSPSPREPSIQQAVTFLRDPRVQTSDPARARAFLHQKGISDAEVAEAYRRIGTPATAHAPLPFLPPAAAAHPLPPRGGGGWFSLLVGLAAAAGAYAALRELLRRYVVPAYFPARAAEDERRVHARDVRARDAQIEELRERVQELVESARRTGEKVDGLSASIASSVAVREREISQSSELRDAIRDLSHSVTVSVGSETSRLRESYGTDGGSVGGYGRFTKTSGAHKYGSLAYGNGGEESSRAEEEGERGKGDVLRSERMSSNMGKKAVEEDEFMAIAPAEVEESWGVRGGPAGQKEELMGAKAEGAKENEREGSRSTEDERASEGGGMVMATVAGWEGRNGVDSARVDGSDEVEAAGGSAWMRMSMASSSEAGASTRDADTLRLQSGSMTHAARQLFEEDLVNEAKYVLGGGGGGSSHSKARALSMPQMDMPLSDDEK